MDVGFERVKHRGAVILGMRAGQHDPVVLDQRQSFAVQILIGNDVEAFAAVFEPTQDVRIGVELPYVGTGTAQGSNNLGLHVDDGPQARAVEYARPVVVNVVEAKAEFRVLLHEQVMFLMLQEPSDHDLRFRYVQCDAVVGVRHVASCRQQDGSGRRRPLSRRKHRERNVELVALRVQTHRV